MSGAVTISNFWSGVIVSALATLAVLVVAVWLTEGGKDGNR